MLLINKICLNQDMVKIPTNVSRKIYKKLISVFASTILVP